MRTSSCRRPSVPGGSAHGLSPPESSTSTYRTLAILCWCHSAIGCSYWTARAESLHEVLLGDGTPFDPHLSPDGKRISFVGDGDLWLVDVDGGKPPRRLTQHPPAIEYGVADFVSQEEFDRPRGYFWSADSQFIAFQRTDASKVTTVYVSDPVHPERAPDEFKYPRAGSENAIVDLGIVSVKGGQPRWVQWDLQKYPYLARVEWPKRGPLTLTVLDRTQTQLALLAVDNPSAAVRELLQATDAAWVELAPGRRPGSKMGRVFCGSRKVSPALRWSCAMRKARWCARCCRRPSVRVRSQASRRMGRVRS